jgi:hypothetical protein
MASTEAAPNSSFAVFARCICAQYCTFRIERCVLHCRTGLMLNVVRLDRPDPSDGPTSSSILLM